MSNALSNELIIGMTFCVYLLLMGGIGIAAYLRTSNLADYILGGRSLGPWVAALSAGASDMSGWLLMGLPGLAYSTGLGALWITLGLLAGTYSNWRLMARRLRAFSLSANDALTLPSYLEARFCCQGKSLRVVAGIVIVIFFSVYTSSGLIAGGKLFEEVFQLPYRTAMTFATLAIVSYTLFGGFLAVSWNDVVQGIMMSSALLVVPCYSIMVSGGWEATWVQLSQSQEGRLLDFWRTSSGEAMPWLEVLSLLGWGLGYFGQPHILARFKAVRSAATIPQARRIATTWTGFCLGGAMLTGIAGLSYFGPGLKDPERVFMNLVNSAFHPGVAGMLLASVLAAIMSTAAAQLLVASSVLAEDFYRACFRSHASNREHMMIGRLAVALITLIAYMMALSPGSMVLDVVAYAWAGFGAAFGPVLLLSLYWRYMSEAGAMAGILSGGITVIVWRQLSGGIFELYEIIPGMLVATLAIVLVSLTTRASPGAIALYERALKENH